MSEFKDGVARQFNRGSSTYDQHAGLQQLMGERLLHRLKNHEEPVRNILELGCGTGGFTRGLLGTFPEARILAIDLAEAMIDVAGQRLGSPPQLRLVAGDAEAVPWPPASFDLIVSNAAVQWFEEPGRTMASLARCLRPGGLMLHSTFGPRTFSELHSTLGEIDSEAGKAVGAYGLPLMTAGNWAGLLADAGMTGVEATPAEEQRHYPDAAAFLRALKGMGATFARYRPPGPARPHAWREIIRRYDERYSVRGGVVVTYEVVEVGGRSPAVVTHASPAGV